jgi:GNAT superfamily N-acetyltransferase
MIRTATKADQVRVLELVQHFLDTTSYGRILGLEVGDRPEGAAQLFDHALEHGVVYLGERSALIVGFIAIAAMIHPLTGIPEGCELAWWMEPEHRRGRLGYKLLGVAEDWTRQKGLRVLKMVAPAGSDVGTFLEHMGYSPVETVFQKVL